MFEKVVAGVDGAQGGRDALALAGLLRADQGELTLAHVYVKESIAWRGAGAAYEAAQREESLELLEAARDEAGLEGAQIRAYGAARIGRGLHELAEHVAADLLVVGSSRRGYVGRVLGGDDTRHALDGAPCAVAIAPAGYAERPAAMQRIGVGYDESPESEHALGVASRLAGEVHGSLAVCRAVVYPTRMFSVYGWPDQASIDDLVGQARERLGKLGDVEPRVTYGLAHEELAEASGSLDLLVVGSRGYGPLGRVLFGSTAQELARGARCPLLVLTRAARRRDASRPDAQGSEAAVPAAD